MTEEEINEASKTLTIGETIRLGKAMKEAYDEEVTAILAEREAEREAEQKNPWPLNGDKYWYVHADGSIQFDYWGNYPFDKGALEMDNLFRTVEEAEAKRDWLRAVALVEKIAREENPAGWERIPKSGNWYISSSAFATIAGHYRAMQALKDAGLYDAYMRRGEG
jgi:hypothetical protein